MNKDITSKRLAKALKDAGMRQRDLAQKANITESSVSHYINGRYTPSKEVAEAMANVLNVSPAWLMGFDVPEKNKYLHVQQYYFQTNAVEELFRSAGWEYEDVPGEDEFVDYDQDGYPIFVPTLAGIKLTKGKYSLTIPYDDYIELKETITEAFNKKFLEILTKNFASYTEDKDGEQNG